MKDFCPEDTHGVLTDESKGVQKGHYCEGLIRASTTAPLLMYLFLAPSTPAQMHKARKKIKQNKKKNSCKKQKDCK